MGKRLGNLFRKSFSTSKFRSTVTKALARIVVLKRQHQTHWSEARSDVVQLLNLDHHESAILLVDHVIREQNLLDALVIIEGYCMILLERTDIIKSSIECPEELKEAIASVIFAASRYGQLPELQKICRIFIKKYGKELVNHANELRNNSGVHPKIAKKLPARRTSLATRLKVLKQIAAEQGVTLHLEGENYEFTQEKRNGMRNNEIFSAYLRGARNKYKDVEQAAQAAYKFANRAAAAAKVAAEIYRTKLPDKDTDDCNRQEKESAKNEVKKWQEESGLDQMDLFEASFRDFSIQMPNTNFGGESKEAGPSNSKVEPQGAASVLASESDSEPNKQMALQISDQNQTRDTKVGSDGKQDESNTSGRKHPWLKRQDWDKEKRFSSFTKAFLSFKNPEEGKDDSSSNKYKRWHSDLSIDHDSRGHYYEEGGSSTEGSSRGRRPISVRTKRTINRTSRGKKPLYI